MGALVDMLPQGPNQHCGSLEPHERHANPSTLYATAWCDGVRPLEPFVELTIRIPLPVLATAKDTHEGILEYLAAHGLGVFVDHMGDKRAQRVMRVRTTDGIDRVYPLVGMKPVKVVIPGEPAE